MATPKYLEAIVGRCAVGMVGMERRAAGGRPPIRVGAGEATSRRERWEGWKEIMPWGG